MVTAVTVVCRYLAIVSRPRCVVTREGLNWRQIVMPVSCRASPGHVQCTLSNTPPFTPPNTPTQPRRTGR